MNRYKNSKFHTLVPLVMILPVLFASLTSATLLIVDSSDESNFFSIQQAIDAAKKGDTILIKNGWYNETCVINKSITIIGETPGNTILNGNYQNVFTVISNDVTLCNMTITQGSNAIVLSASNCTIHTVTFLKNDLGLVINNTSRNNSIYQNNFIQNILHAKDHSNQTSWHKNMRGNFWDDYTGTDANNDSIGDTPYIIFENVSDLFPLINPNTRHPNAHFEYEPTNPTTQTKISFTDQSTDSDGTITSWLWDFGDGTNSTKKHPTHQYADDGTYLISLTVVDNLGSSTTYSYSLIIENVPPIAYFTYHPTEPLDIQEVDIRDNSTDVDGKIVNRTWIINNTLHEYSSMFRYTFPDDGIYTVTLMVTDDDNETSSYTKEITVLNVGPSAGFTYSTQDGTLSKESPINFKDTSQDVDGTIISYQWEFGDGTTSTKKHPTHTFSTDGRYKVTLHIEDNDGEQDSYAKQIQIGSSDNSKPAITPFSFFDIIIIIIIFSSVITVIIIAKKYSFS
ncbi:MAG: PKD domain-containing protein [Candidatus Thermoplasmatota archaeon]|nr:PKD domain-containing protein [Candidatus Thermoplasmatota archaeon]